MVKISSALFISNFKSQQGGIRFVAELSRQKIPSFQNRLGFLTITMDSKSDNVSGSSCRQQGRYLHHYSGVSAVPCQTSECGILENTSNAVEGCCFAEYYEVMSPGLNNWGMESGAASSSTSMSDKGVAASASETHSQTLHIEGFHSLPYKKRYRGGSNIRDPRIRRAIELSLLPNLVTATEASAKGADCVHASAEKSTKVRPCEAQHKHMSAFKNKLVEHIKLLLHPAWKQGHLSKDDFKGIVMKITRKVVESIPQPKIPDTREKIEAYLAQSGQKIQNIVQQYLKLHEAKGSRA